VLHIRDFLLNGGVSRLPGRILVLTFRFPMLAPSNSEAIFRPLQHRLGDNFFFHTRHNVSPFLLDTAFSRRLHL
jgi:hypothetical protein